MSLLKETPGSVLWLYRSNEASEPNLRKEAEGRGVDPDRLVFAETLPKDEHLARYRLADLVLDTRICGGHTTTSDALWAGVPVVSVQGRHFASRVSASLLSAVGLPELVANDMDSYKKLALHLAQHPDELAALKEKLAQNRMREPLFDTARFVANLEKAYREIWRKYCTAEPPSYIDVATL